MDARRRFSYWALALLTATVFVILWGAVVRITGSGAGCADHWPLCNGEFIPRSPRLATVIELTHRVTSSLAGLLSVLVFVLARRRFERGAQVRRAAGWGLLLMLVEGAIGALLVKRGLVAQDASEARALVVALHLCNTFLLLGAQVATFQLSRAQPVDPRGSAREQNLELRLRGKGLLPWLLLAALGLLLVLGASGAVTALGDTLFPAKSLGEGVASDFSRQAHVLVRLRVFHPLLALGVGALVVYLAQHTRAALGSEFGSRGDPRASMQAARWATLVTWSFVAQVALGFANLLLLAPAPVQILHLLLADLTWIALVQLYLAVLSAGAGRAAGQLSLERAAS